MPLIEVKNIEKIYIDDGVKTLALAGVSFEVQKGEFVAVMGPSGSGKSTLLHILGFLDRPTGGEYRFEEKSMDEYSDDELAKVRNKRMGFVFQAFNLLPRTTVLENVKLPLLYADIPDQKQDEIAKKVIEIVGLTKRLHHESSQLSGGERQRLAIARAFVNNPSVIFADEPTGNLDSKSGGQIMEFIAKLHAKGHTIFLITHETYIAEYAERIIRLKDGLIESDEKISRHRHAMDHYMR